MKRVLIALCLIVAMLSSSIALAQAYEVTQWNRYSKLKVGPLYTNNWNTALSWLSDHTYYKGRIWASPPVLDREVRFRQQMFDHRNSYYWCGYGYNNIYQQVLEAQRALAYLGDNSWSNVDGIWGPVTYNAVRSFQSRAGIGVDGIVGRNTWDHMVYTQKR